MLGLDPWPSRIQGKTHDPAGQRLFLYTWNLYTFYSFVSFKLLKIIMFWCHKKADFETASIFSSYLLPLSKYLVGI